MVYNGFYRDNGRKMEPTVRGLGPKEPGNCAWTRIFANAGPLTGILYGPGGPRQLSTSFEALSALLCYLMP